jgi:hypothetical protein
MHKHRWILTEIQHIIKKLPDPSVRTSVQKCHDLLLPFIGIKLKLDIEWHDIDLFNDEYYELVRNLNVNMHQLANTKRKHHNELLADYYGKLLQLCPLNHIGHIRQLSVWVVGVLAIVGVAVILPLRYTLPAVLNVLTLTAFWQTILVYCAAVVIVSLIAAALIYVLKQYVNTRHSELIRHSMFTTPIGKAVADFVDTERVDAQNENTILS